jgi:DNA-binding NarL/FixJ family response regulator
MNNKEMPAGFIRYTKREREIVVLIAEGLSNKEIAESLHIATHAVKSHVRSILEKLTRNKHQQIDTFAGKGPFG